MKQGYLVGELAQHFGVSKDTIRLYDKAGIVSPKRNQRNGYRYYSREDFICLAYAMELRKISLSMEEIRVMMNESSIQHGAQVMTEQERLIEKKIEELKRLRSIVEDYKLSFQNGVNGLDQYRIVENPIFIYRDVGDSLIETSRYFSELTDYHVPKFTFVVPRELFLSEEFDDVNVAKQKFTYAVSLRDEQRLSERKNFPADRFQVVHYERCVHTALKFYTNVNYDSILELKRFVLRKGYTMIGNLLLRVISIKNDCKTNVDYYEAWVPIE